MADIELGMLQIQTGEHAERRIELRAAESSEQRETRLARRRVADKARFAAISRYRVRQYL